MRMKNLDKYKLWVVFWNLFVDTVYWNYKSKTHNQKNKIVDKV